MGSQLVVALAKLLLRDLLAHLVCMRRGRAGVFWGLGGQRGRRYRQPALQGVREGGRWATAPPPPPFPAPPHAWLCVVGALVGLLWRIGGAERGALAGRRGGGRRRGVSSWPGITTGSCARCWVVPPALPGRSHSMQTELKVKSRCVRAQRNAGGLRQGGALGGAGRAVWLTDMFARGGAGGGGGDGRLL